MIIDSHIGLTLVSAMFGLMIVVGMGRILCGEPPRREAAAGAWPAIAATTLGRWLEKNNSCAGARDIAD
ncbi:MAG: hypothetical protein BGP06_21295 [Rhizobiales bacterium 65-9]|nr:hypothetical protein [Hyphomicrobiales bacterium]OJY36544.1 MAG: hypothetical protein BGP06_21295 [Rhizobiales bacterium 65-9]